MRILRFSRVVSDLARAEAFYRDVLGFRTTRSTADTATLRLGAQDIALVQCAVPGRPYPPDSQSNDLWFQHLAIVVNDMPAAYAHLSAHTGWTPITQGGPQTLPPSNSAVQAFKFRDPDGHPLELIRFPRQPPASAALFQRIDHSALSIADTKRSLAFYGGLGFHVTQHSLNHGPAQARLDALPNARVAVTTLRPDEEESAGFELLAYQPPGNPIADSQPHDIQSDCITLAAGSDQGVLRDPDGHLLLLADQ